jgi:hypothetical protein
MAKKPIVGSKPAARPVAMVTPPPTKPLPSLTLEEILNLAGNNRAYSVISSHGHIWKVHFEGDYKPSLVNMEKGKPVIALIQGD